MIDQSDSALLFDRALDCQNRGLPQEALVFWDALLERQLDHAPIHFHRARALVMLGRFGDAVESLDRALLLHPADPDALGLKGVALQNLGQSAASLQAYDRAADFAPAHAEVHYNRGTLLHQLGRLEDALAAYDRTIRFQPNFSAAHNNRGLVLRDMKRLEDALESFDSFLALRPNRSEAFHNKAHCSLLMGRFDEGWPLYEFRKTLIVPLPSQAPDRPYWTDDASLAGKTLLIHAEQGLGDTIQFCRYASLALEQGANIILSVPALLMRLLKNLDPRITIADAGLPPPDCDYQILLMSLPLAFKTGANTIPARIPYLQAEPERVRHWAQTIGTTGFRIGIVWQGDPLSTADVGRSFPLRHFSGLAKIPGVRLISLQKNKGSEQLADLPSGMTVETPGGDFDAGPDAFIDTAALMESLDLVITADTAVAHLAGALGRPVWVALKHVPDWRWMLDRDDTPWYPTMRLFRQEQRGDWAGVFAAMEGELSNFLATRASVAAPTPKVAISWGELLDKLTILEIKREKIADPTAQANVVRELSQLQALAAPVLASDRDIETLVEKLREINRYLWNIESQIRDKETAGAFDAEFVALARSVYFRNDERGAVKKKINQQLTSEYVEEKYYGGA